MTQQKQVILQKVRDSRTHPTADEVYEMARQSLPRISLGTVYRNLDSLSRDGLIRTLEGSGPRRYDGDLEKHCHVRCKLCSYIRDTVPVVEISLEEASQSFDGFMVTDYHIEFVGMCGECRERLNAERTL
jgi:Fur family ferric uptake transcriptional regulator